LCPWRGSTEWRNGWPAAGRRLLEAYIDMVNEYHPTAIADNPHLHQQDTTPNSYAT
jgi:hypothetical protein